MIYTVNQAFCRKNQQGFTLIELMVAIVIFAVMALAGWQIMDGLTKSRERAKIQSERLAQLEFAYVQLLQDFSQVINYMVMPTNLINNNQQNLQNNIQSIPIDTSQFIPTFQLNATSVNFIRFANPDPRYVISPVLAKVQYLTDNDKLVRQRFYQLADADEKPNNSVILDNVKDVKWTAFIPDKVDEFPNKNPQMVTGLNFPDNSQIQMVQNPFSHFQQLPKAVQIEFSYHDEPIVWRFLLPETAPPEDISQPEVPQGEKS